jgi:DNA-binding MarR family transcriptional regulator
MPQTISFLLAQICKAHRACADDALTEIGLHVGQELFLWHLWEEDGLTQSQLAEHMCVQPPTVNKMLSRMESAGLVERRTDAEDNRVSRVHLTEQSRCMQQAVENAWSRLEERTVANLTPDEQILLRRLLLQVFQNLTDEQ